jgi:predicted ester cyclase
MDNIEAVKKLEVAYNARDYDTVRSIVATDFVSHTAGSEMMPPGVEGAIAADESAWTSYPDKKSEILDIFGERDRVVAHIRMTGTNKGGLSWMGVPANDRPIDTDWIQISRHDDDGRIVETWAQMDVVKMMSQLGVMPSPGGM